MNDPLSPLTAPPPRYLLESDSSDEEGQGAYPLNEAGGPSKPKLRVQSEIQVAFTGLENASQGEEVDEVVIGLGQAGKYILKTIQGEAEIVGSVKIGTSNIGVVANLGAGKSRLITINESNFNGEESWTVIKSLIEKVKAKKWTIITLYVPSMYIPSPSERSERFDIPPIRVLSSTAEVSQTNGLKGFDAPNYLTGIAGGIVSLASHPTSSIPIPTTILLPLPLSSIPSSQLQTTVKSTSSTLLAHLGKSVKYWSEDDDEPYSAPGMGRVRGLKQGVGEFSSMYM